MTYGNILEHSGVIVWISTTVQSKILVSRDPFDLDFFHVPFERARGVTEDQNTSPKSLIFFT